MNIPLLKELHDRSITTCPPLFSNPKYISLISMLIHTCAVGFFEVAEGLYKVAVGLYEVAARLYEMAVL